ncbi:FtsX-like permease family protein [Paenibacillus sp. Dod16]|uniref:FtsX-like permease family protein n=1 Tax=Paenibacillus sp. Dod16 TaxID=3416392 RepID=UPI003CFAAB39
MPSVIRKDIAFVLVFVCLFSLCFSFQIFSIKQKLYFELSNDLYTKNHAVFVNNNDWIPSEKLGESNYRIFFEVNNSYRFLIQNNGEWKPPMLSGHFFSETDQELQAVVGKEMIQYLQKENEKSYVFYQGNKYYVTGILGKNYASSSDYLAILHHPNPQIPTDGRIILDSDSKATVNKITKRLNDLNPSITQIKSTQKGLYRTGNVSYYYHLLWVEMYLLVLFSILAFLRYWYEKEQYEINVLFLLGIPKKMIQRKLVIKASLLILLSNFISFGLFYAFNPVPFSHLVSNACIFLLASWTCMYIFIRNGSLRHKSGVANSDIK